MEIIKIRIWIEFLCDLVLVSNICDPILEKVVKGEKRKTRLFTFQTKTHLNTV